MGMFKQRKRLGFREQEESRSSSDSAERFSSPGAALALEGVRIEFGDKLAVEETDLRIKPGEFLCLIGPSGCGKSTLLNVFAGFVKPTKGRVTSDGREIRDPGPDRGMVFQHHSLLPWKRVKDNVALGPIMAGHGKREAESTARTFLGLVGLEKYANAWPSELSGGMKQRVGIARALANYPSVILMDEPFGALDAQTRSILQQATLKVWDEFKKTVVFVTHDIDEAVLLADRIAIMSSAPGRIIREIQIDLPRPRDELVVTSEKFIEHKKECLELIRQETLKAFE